MITHLSGTIIHITEKSIIIDVRGVGYEIYATPATLTSMGINDHVSLWTYPSIKETTWELFGFTTHGELLLFKLLTDVSGIGPRSALAIIGLAPTDVLMQAIVNADANYLTQVSGIGKKIAGKIILELKDKLEKMDITPVEMDPGDHDVVEALQSLGYSAQQSREALRAIPAEVTHTSDRIKYALQTIPPHS